MTRLCFIDTETTSLRPDRRAWDIAIIVREDGKPADVEHQWFVGSQDLDLGNADLISLSIGRFYERHPDVNPALVAGVPATRHSPHPEWENELMHEIEVLTRGAHLIGAVPNFDAEVLAARMRAHGICPSWHYHLICVETLAAGWLHRHAAVLELREQKIEGARLRACAAPPWKSDELAAELGVRISNDEERHTALGDARWARDIYDAATRPV